jgi:hypothetical protein
MPPVLAVLFWVWVVVSIVVLVKRRAARKVERELAAVEVDHTGLPAPEPAAEPVSELAMAAAVAPMTAEGAPAKPTPPPGFEQPVAPVVERPAARSAPAAGIADALVGIRMPCDLVPLVFDRLATDKITLSTTGHPAEVVGASLADEVERLGYVVRPLSDHEVIATRGVTELRMSIERPGPDGRHLHHPNARDDSVVVEITLS